MIFGIFTILTAIVISAISAYYSVLGLTAIFSAAAAPVMIMGAALEAGKIMTAIWLHNNWDRARLQYKMYLVPAVVFLMLLTSMGVFGFLSKAHNDQNLISGDVQAKIAIYDEKIKTARENIEIDRQHLAQLDAVVDQVLVRSSDQQGASKSNTLRQNQRRDRMILAKSIQANQLLITNLNNEAAPIRAEMRKVEADVGPVKYIASFVYGSNPDANILERAVTWVIILIVIVFDPLAVVLILAGLRQIEWDKQDKLLKSVTEQSDKVTEELSITPAITEPIIVDNSAELELELAREQVKKLNDLTEHQRHILETRQDEIQTISQTLVSLYDDYQKISIQNETSLSRNFELLQQLTAVQDELAVIKLERNRLFQAHNYEMARADELANKISELSVIPEPTVSEVIVPEPVIPEPVTLDVPEPVIPEVTAPPVEDFVFAPPPKTDFGTEFPGNPQRGDMFLRVDFNPGRLFKWNDTKWIEINKSITDAYAYNEQYIQFLMEKLNSGEYSYEDLDDTELQQIQLLLGINNGRF